MGRTIDDVPKGLVDPAGAARRIRLARIAPSGRLKPFVDYHWIVEWDLNGQPAQVQRTLPYPNAHLAFERDAAAVFGVPKGVFERRLEGAGRVLGVRFRPGGLRPFLDGPVSALAGRVVSVAELFGWDEAQAGAQVQGAGDDAGMIAAAEALLMAALPVPDPAVDEAERVVALAERREGPATAAALAVEAGMSLRGLQRLFSDYVGAPPKWVIARYRLHEAAWRLAQQDAPDLADLAAELGYFDQSHFNRDFTRMVGLPPGEYRRTQQAARAR